jgi:transcriptional regulator with XRE-family HTH domain
MGGIAILNMVSRSKILGGDPRANNQHSMNRIPIEREEEILRLLLGEFSSDLQVRVQEGRINQDISPSRIEILDPAIDAGPSEVDAISGPGHFGNWLQSALISRGMTQTAIARESGVSADSIGKIIRGQIRNPRNITREAIQAALGQTLTIEISDAIMDEINIEGLGEFSDFDPHSESSLWPDGAGVYVFYDISQRPVYVGQSGNVRRRLKGYTEGTRRPWWFAKPIVESAAFIPVEDETNRKQLEKIMIIFLKSNAILNKTHVRR